MFVEKKIIHGKFYFYLKHSFRLNGKVKTKTLAYIGNTKDSDKIKKFEKIFNEKKLDEIKKELEKEKINWSEILLLDKDKERIKEIKKSFVQKLKILDKKTKKEMFDDFLTCFVFNTNAIEGNTLTLKETDLLLNKGITPQGKTLREINDHLNSKEVFYYLQEKNPPITCKTIILIHDKLMKNIDERMGYRDQNVRVVGTTFKSTPFQYVKTDMDLLLKWYKKNKTKLHPVVLGALFHHKFEKIHPFYDGNGRTGRMILNLILLQNKIPPVVLSNKQRKTYYLALSKADKIGLTEIKENFKFIVKFISTQILKTHNTIFKYWGK